MLKLFWPLLIVNLRIPGLIWWGTAYFVQNNTIIILPSDTQRTTSELPCRTSATRFWRQIISLEIQKFHIFYFFAIWYGLWNCKSLLVCEYSMPSLMRNVFPLNYHLRQDSNVFPACWILIGQFKFRARQPYARRKVDFHISPVVCFSAQYPKRYRESSRCGPFHVEHPFWTHKRYDEQPRSFCMGVFFGGHRATWEELRLATYDDPLSAIKMLIIFKMHVVFLMIDYQPIRVSRRLCIVDFQMVAG